MGFFFVWELFVLREGDASVGEISNLNWVYIYIYIVYPMIYDSLLVDVIFLFLMHLLMVMRIYRLFRDVHCFGQKTLTLT